MMILNNLFKLTPGIIILLILLFLVVFFFVKAIIIKIDCFYKSLKAKREYYNSLNFFSNFGCVFGIGGKIGAGKTTLLALLSNIFNIDIKRKLKNKMDEIKIKLPYVPFNRIDIEFKEGLMNGQTFDQIRNELLKKYQDDYKLRDYHYDYLNYTENLKLLSDYMYYMYHFLRDNHVMSNIKVYDHLSGTYSYMYSDEYIKLKEGSLFPIDNYSFIFNDEGALTNSNKNAISKLNQDDGSDVFDRLVRNASGGTIYKATTTQDITRLQKLEREIMVNIIYVLNHYICGVSRMYLRNLAKRKMWIERFYSLVLRFKKDILYPDSYNYFRKKLKAIQDKENKHINNAFIRFDVAVYNDSEKSGKKITEEMEDSENYYASITGPVNYAWGTVDSYSFSKLFDYLRERSLIKPGTQGRSEIDVDYINKILKKFKKETAAEETAATEKDFIF